MLQPIRRFCFEAAILLSDVIPHALGQAVSLLEGEGPQRDPVTSVVDLPRLAEPLPLRFAPVFDTLARVKGALPPATTLLGFCGPPWAVASLDAVGHQEPPDANSAH